MKFPQNLIGQVARVGILALSLTAGTSGIANETTLTLHLQGIRNDQGNIRISLYQTAESFRKEDQAIKLIRLPARPGTLTATFTALPPGRYAVMAYHDENNDEKMNLRFGMFPIEGYALSNNPKVVGPPRFTDSAFDFPLQANAPLELTVNY